MLFVFHIALTALENACIQLFSFQFWVNFNLDAVTDLREGKLLSEIC